MCDNSCNTVTKVGGTVCKPVFNRTRPHHTVLDRTSNRGVLRLFSDALGLLPIRRRGIQIVSFLLVADFSRSRTAFTGEEQK